MNCPACGLYHPAFYERCVACGESLNAAKVPADQKSDSRASLTRIRFSNFEQEEGEEERDKYIKSGSHSIKPRQKQSFSNKKGIFIALFILLVFASATAFFFMRSPDDRRLLQEGKQQLSIGQYAFAVQTLSKAAALRPNDPNVYLALARAYIGVDQVKEAWDCITRAQQLGAGVIADPALATELANYYKQHGQLDKAIDLLRPLASAGIKGKKADLADLDAMHGDDCIEQGKLDEAKRLWEEVEQLNEGVRATEAKSRLATIYLKLVDIAYSKGEDTKALDYLNKVNTLEENPRNYILAADICEHSGQLNEAINQLQKALNLNIDDQAIKNKLAQLYLERGKEIIQSGNTSDGYAYFQKANSIDPAIGYPNVAIKDLKVNSSSNRVSVSGDFWNPNDKSINNLVIRAQLYDSARGIAIWQKDQRIIDDFVAPLQSQQTKRFNFIAPLQAHGQENLAFRLYVDDILYGTYPLKPGTKLSLANTTEAPQNVKAGTNAENKEIQKADFVVSKKEKIENMLPQPAVPERMKPHKAQENLDLSGPDSSSKPEAKRPEAENPVSAEEKTMKDLEF